MADVFESMAEKVREREMSLRESEEKYRTILASVGDAVIATDLSGKITFMNKIAEELTGWAISEASAMPVADVFHIINEHTRNRVEDPVAKVLKEGVVVGLANHTVLVGKSGKEIPIDDSGAPIRDEDGRLSGVVLVFHDITERKHAEAAFSRSQKTFSELVERAPFGIYVVDSQFRIAQMNIGSQTGAFQNVRPVIGRDFNEVMRILWPEPVAAEIIAHFRHTLDTGEPYYSRNFINPRQDVEIEEAYEWELHRMMLAEGQYGVTCYYFDSTKLREAEAAQRESEERFRSVAENMSEGLMLFDAQGMIYQNPASLRLHGYSVQEDGRIALEKLPATWQGWDDQGCPLSFDHWPISRVVRGERFQNQVFHAHRQDTGLEFDASYNGCPIFDAAGKMVLGFITIREITEQRKAEIALRASEERFRVAQELMPDGFSILRPVRDTRRRVVDFTWVYANAAMEHIVGMKLSALAGRSLLELFPGHRGSAFVETYQQVAETGKTRVQEMLYEADGVLPQRWFRVAVVSMGQDIAVLSQDITDRKRTEEALQKRSSELQHLTETLEDRVKERTAELADLSSQLVFAQENERKRVSYELHDNVWQTLVAIRFDVERLFADQDRMDRAVLQDTSKNIMAALLEAVGKIRSMQGDLWPYVLDDIGILATIDWYCREFEKNHPGLTTERQDGLAEHEIISSAKIVIYRILLETLNNVAQHSQANRVFLRLLKKDNRMEFTVTDNGQGFDLEETIAKKSPWGGLGLLSLKARTELSGGRFEVESAPGQGTTVRSSWPI